KDGKWEVKMGNLERKKVEVESGDYMFMGGGGWGIGLLEKRGMGERKELGGLGMRGGLLVCKKGEVVEKEDGKV
ncbi:malate:quinone oxidoreductase, partial [Staphylococcus pettenkoferi]|uniref:malate:quinone oxidoreductase n=1 Tax=Staphylococcus pettenkoferi TaxID=170573 RepID=UPI0016434FD8